ncbi:MAG TPA: hypothetical protein DCY74_08485 [Clostridiales bacterium]|mgnify:CR=1 FL=1|nr:hypothetical protein [Clostridiales bacterium]
MIRHDTLKTFLRDSVIFSLFGSVMFGSKLLMEILPNVHLLGMFIMMLTLVYRTRALIPIYMYVFLAVLFYGFAYWWIPYLYIWTILWGITMLLPKQLSKSTAMIVYPLVCGLHGLSFGILYAPVQALIYGFTLQGTISWIVMGFPFDVMHGISNVVMGTMVLPLSTVLKRLNAGKFR